MTPLLVRSAASLGRVGATTTLLAGSTICPGRGGAVPTLLARSATGQGRGEVHNMLEIGAQQRGVGTDRLLSGSSQVRRWGGREAEEA